MAQAAVQRAAGDERLTPEVVLQSLLARGTVGALQGAFWWATGISVAALIPALALPARAAARD